jgi:glutamate 5-kinase
MRVRARTDLAQVRRVVVKVGSALLADIDGAPFARLGAQMAELHARNIDVVLVTSGAIALGLAPLGLRERPTDLASLQAAAAAGQSRLMGRWMDAFDAHHVHLAQILLTHDDLRDRRRYLNARQALLRLLDARIIPVINENDTVAVDEIKVGDNDTLAAAICGLVDADAVVLLTGASGLYTADPNLDPSATRVPIVDDVNADIRKLAGAAARLGTGGMITKLDAAVVARAHGACTLVAPGRHAQVLQQLLQGADIGTLVLAPAEERGSARRRWIATALRPQGVLWLDDGAARAVMTNASLLAVGVREVEGRFHVGDCVGLGAHTTRTVFARGLVQLADEDIRVIAGKPRQAAMLLLPDAPVELVHRDDLALLAGVSS